MPTTQQANIVNSKLIRNQVAIYRWQGASSLDMATILAGFVPSGGDWLDVTGAIDMQRGMTIRNDGRGMVASFDVYRQDRSEWRASNPLAIAARHWDGIAGVWGAWYTVLVGNPHGGGEQERRRGGLQWGGVSFSNRRLLDLTRIGAHKFGRRNLMQTATFTGGTTALANPDLESPLEYRTQRAGVGGEMAIDGYADTPAITDTIADTAPSADLPTNIYLPRVVRIYNGRPGSRAIGAGNRSIFVEVTAGAVLNTWGDFENAGTIPDYFEGGPAIGDFYNRKGEIVAGAGYGGGNAYRWTAKVENSGGVNRIMAYQQWNIQSAYTDRPFSWSVRLKTDDAQSVGRRIQITAAPIYGAQKEIRNISLSNEWQYFELQFDSTGNYGGGMIRIRPEDQSISNVPLKWLVDDLYLSIGYAERDGFVVPQGRYALVLDDGIGNIRWIRPAWEGGGGGQFVIPPYKTVVFTDDEAILQKNFDPGGAQVVSLKNVYPEFFFAPAYGGNPATGRIRGQNGGWGANGTPYDWNDNGAGTIHDDINLATVNGGVPWTENQALLRQAPLATGQLSVEANPTIGLSIVDQYGPSYWYYALPDYEPTILLDDIGAGIVDFHVRDYDTLDTSGYVLIGTEWIAYSGISDNGLLDVTGRGQFGTTAAAHTAGDLVRLRIAGASQTGQRIDQVELRRKSGTPVIQAGAILYSNLAVPGDPGVGGSKFELHPDWQTFAKFENNASEVVVFGAPGGWVQARHICVVVRRMARHNGIQQRAKINEIVAREYLPGGSSGRYASHTANSAEAIIGHLLIQHGGVPDTKYLLGGTTPNTPIGDLSLADGMAGAIVDSVARDNSLAVWMDGLGYARTVADPLSPFFDARTVEWTWNIGHFWENPRVSYRDENEIAQVRVIARDGYSWRMYDEVYPPVPLPYGKVLQIKDVTVPSRRAAQNIAKRAFYAQNAKRSLTVSTGAVPFVAPYQRHVADLPGVDLGGGAENINYYVSGYEISVKREAFGLSWRTAVQLRELALNGPNGG